MKITLHSPDGTSTTFTNCRTFETHRPAELGFIGTDEWDRQVKMLTTLPYTITEILPIEEAKVAAKELRESIYRQ